MSRMDLTPLSYDAELSCLSESSTSLAREKKKSAIIIWQPTNHYFRSKSHLSLVKTLTDNTTGQHSLFLDSSFFFSTQLAYFFRLKFKISTCVCSHNICLGFFSIHEHIFCKSKLIFCYCIQCLLQVSTYILCFQHVFFPSVQFCPQQNAIVSVQLHCSVSFAFHSHKYFPTFDWLKSHG